MELNIATTVDAARWDDALARAGGTVFHSSAWAAYAQAEQPSAESRYFTFRGDDGATVGLALGFLTRSRHPVLSALTGRLWLDAMPVVVGGDARLTAGCLATLEAYARDERLVRIDVGSFASPGSSWTLEDLGFDVHHRLEFELALTPGDDAAFEALAYKRRKNLRKSERLGVEVREMTGAVGVGTLRALQAESSARIVARGGPDVSFHGDNARDPFAVLLGTGRARLLGAFVDGECVSAGLFTVFNGMAYYMASGHGPRALEVQAPTRLLWDTMAVVRREGVERFNLGGCQAEAMQEGSPEHGVYAFKTSMGATPIACESASRILRRQVYELTGLVRRSLRR